MIMHIDGNGFYAACEGLFRPDLDNKPIVVLSNNDGIVIALNQSAKNLGFTRGDAYFKTKSAFKAKGVTVFSSNYTLYADMCVRVNMIYNSYCPEVEMYSIDESFLFYPDWKNTDWAALAHRLRTEVQKQTHIPVSIGIAPTKTLAKMCNKLAKHVGGVCYWHSLDKKQTLQNYAVSDIWGIGKSKTHTLSLCGIQTAYDLQQFPLHLAKKQLTIQGFNTVQELNEIVAIEQIASEKRQNICCSKSFAHTVSTLAELETALSEYVQLAVTRMREEKQACTYVMVYLKTASEYTGSKSEQVYENGASAKLETSTSFLPLILATALKLLHSIYQSGFLYRKVMINLLGLQEDRETQLDLFNNQAPAIRKTHNALMSVCDNLNDKYGRGCVHLGVRNQIADTQKDGTKAHWLMQRKLLSPAYTTKLSDIPKVY